MRDERHADERRVIDEREATIEHFLEKNRLFYHRYLQLGGDRLFAEMDLTMPQLRVLFLVVSLDGATMSQISRGTRMTLSTATGVADRLIAQGFVRRADDPEDRRVVWLVPTAKAISLVERITQFGREHLSLVVRRLDLEELCLVARAQDILYDALLEITTEDIAHAERSLSATSRSEAGS
jgi:DNA-binding MarR family transcriptional regulator